MIIVMLSLDKNIIDPSSATAKRMVEYGKTDELFIVIPDVVKREVILSPTVRAQTTGGKNKLVQAWQLYNVAERYLLKHPADLITAQDPFWLGFIAWQLQWQFKTPIEVQVHGDFFTRPRRGAPPMAAVVFNYYRNGSLGARLRYWLGRFVIGRANHVRVVGERVRQSILQLGLAPEKINVHSVPVDEVAIRNYQPALDLHTRYPKSEKIFLVLGRFDPIKNIAWLIGLWPDVIKQKPNFRLLIVGDGPERARLEALVRESQLWDTVKFEPWTNDPWSYIKATDCLLFPSLAEGYGLVVREAVAAGTPVIMTDVGVANYEVKAGPKVTIVPVGDGARLKKAIIALGDK